MQLRLELLHALFAVDERRRVVAQAEDTGTARRVSDSSATVTSSRSRIANITSSVDHRRGEREDAAHHEVLDRVGVDVDAVDGVARAGRDVMVQAERLQMLEQPVAQVVDHPLPGVDLHLRAVRRDELVEHLQHDAGDDER